MITSLIKMLQLPDFGHMFISTISFESRDEIFVDDVNLYFKIPLL